MRSQFDRRLVLGVPPPEAERVARFRHANAGSGIARGPRRCAAYFFLIRSTSAVSCFVILSATSALAPRNFAPLLSCVVDHITSPSLLTSRTVAIASCLRSLMLVDSVSPTPRLSERAALRLVLPPPPLKRVPVFTPL